MKPIAVLCLLVASTMANGYGQRQLSYGQPAPLAPQMGYGQSDSSYGGSSTRLIEVIPITRFSHDINGAQSSSVDYQSGNGISVSESVQQVPSHGGSYDMGDGRMAADEGGVRQQGSYSYTSPDGTPISVSYVADENGFHAEGAHLPVAPAMTPEVSQAYGEAISVLNAAYADAGQSYGQSSYSAPVQTYSAPAPVRQFTAYSAPAAPVVQTYSAPAAPVVQTYSAPAAPVVQTYSAPAAPVVQTYSAPAAPVSVRFESRSTGY